MKNTDFEAARIEDVCMFLEAVLSRYARPVSQLVEAGKILGFHHKEIEMALHKLNIQSNVYWFQEPLGTWQILLRK